MSFVVIVKIIAIFCCGTAAGILFGDRMGATFARPALSPSSFLQFQRIQHIHFQRMMPPLLLTAIITGAGWLFAARDWSGLQFWLVATALAAVVVATAMTRAVNIPINNQLMTWNVDAPPGNMREIWARWEKTHTLRTILWLCAFALEAVALGFFV